MLKIRLQRSGRKKRPNYRIVVAEHSAPIKGRYVDIVGTFDPLVEKHGLIVDMAKVEEWIKKGAKPTNTVARLLKGKGENNMDGFIVEMKDRAVKNPKEVKEKPATPAAEAPVADEGGATTDEKPAEPAPEAPAAEEEKKEEAPAETPAEDIPQDDQGGSGEAKKDDAEPEKPAEEKKEAPAEEEKKEEESA